MRIGLLQISVMGILWRKGACTVAQIQQELREFYAHTVSHQTVRSTLRVLRLRGWVDAYHAPPEWVHMRAPGGYMKVYKAVKSRQELIDEYTAYIREA